MSAESKVVSRPQLYREMSVPFPSIDAAEAALAAFNDDLAELRKKHKLADVVCLVEVGVIGRDGQEGIESTSLSFGDSRKVLGMLAENYGRERTRVAESLARAVGGRRL